MAKKTHNNMNSRRVVYFSLMTFVILLLLSMVKLNEISILRDLKVKSIDIISLLTDTTSDVVSILPDALLVDSYKNELNGQRSTRNIDTLLIPSDSMKIIPNSKYHLYDYSVNSDLSTRLMADLKRAECHQGLLKMAFLGDSFIEGDILTCDVRRLLQNRFGGKGIGYIPISSTTSGYRKNVIHKHDGWKTRSIVDIQKKELIYEKFTFSGSYFEANEGAFVSLTLGSKNDTTSVVNQSKLLYSSNNNTIITPIINDVTLPSYTTLPSSEMQSLDYNGQIRSIKYIISNTKGFTAYGVYLNDSTGVWVDNYSVRGSAGTALFPTHGTIHSKFNKLLPYNIIVLQYGLNITESNRIDYSGYKKRMVDVIARLKIEHPQAICILMSVGDRAHKSNQGFVTMPGIQAMVSTQREIAKEAGVMFWNTYEAMGGENSMSSFVNHNPPLAAKDYTHINHAGGRLIAQVFVKALFSLIDDPVEKNSTHE